MKKALHIIKNTAVVLLVVLAVAMTVFTVFSVTTLGRNDRSLFGYKMYIVNSDSMAATDFDAGDLILVKNVDPAALQVGDIITFMSQNVDNFGQTVTHKIRALTTDATGKPGFITYGTTTDTNDETVVTYPFVLGKYESRIPHLGTFFNFLKSPLGYFLCIFLPFMLVIIHEGLRFFRLLRSYKAAQNQSIREERERLEQERQANEALLKELQALKDQLNAQVGQSAPAEEMDAKQTQIEV